MRMLGGRIGGLLLGGEVGLGSTCMVESGTVCIWDIMNMARCWGVCLSSCWFLGGLGECKGGFGKRERRYMYFLGERTDR